MIAYTAERTWVHGEIVSAAIGNTFWRDNGLVTPAALASTAGQTVYSTAANAIAMIPGAKHKTADQTHASNVTDDTHLAWAVAANEVWAWTLFLHLVAASPISMLAKFTFPAAGAGRYHNFWADADIDAAVGTPVHGTWVMGTTHVLCSASVAGRLMLMTGVYVNGANAGTVQFQWGNSGAVSVTAKLGSYIDLKRLA